ncbi:MAG: DUF4197 domain-containing protein [Saprospirales bacterium]|nr:MAG: DUF4197 domain-containing protein [Saprospirales bacterium]
MFPIKATAVILLLAVTLQGCSSSDMRRILDIASERPLSDEEVAMGLKEALNKGVESGVGFLGTRDGFLETDYKILLPSEARQITDRLQRVPGFFQVESIVLERINRSAEDAVSRATPIFRDAIRQMTVRDAWDILRGDDYAATNYLILSTRESLYDEFNPVILDALEKFNALEYWENAVNAYNQIPFIEESNPRLDDYVTNQALDALFDRIAVEERSIRHDINKRTSDLLRRVFAQQDEGT